MDTAKLVKEFNTNLRYFISCVEIANKNDPEVITVKNTMLAALSASELMGINNMGPYLYKYREAIMAADEAFFLNADYSEYADAQSLIEKAKSTWIRSNSAERQLLQSQLQAMTIAYIKYCLAKKRTA